MKNLTVPAVFEVELDPDNSNKPRKTLPRTKFTTSPRLAVESDLGISLKDDSQKRTTEDVAKSATSQLPFFVADDCRDLPHQGKSEGDNFFESVWVSKTNIDAVLVELSRMNEEQLAMRINGGTKKTTAKETALSIGDSSPQDLKRTVSTAVSSGFPRPDVSDRLKLRPSFAANEFLEETKNSEYKLPEYERTWSSGNAIDSVLVELSRMTEEQLAMRMNGGTKKPTAKETALSIGDSSSQDLKRTVSTAVSSGVPRPDVSDTLKLRPSFAANEFLEETKNSEYKLPEYERTWSSGNAIDAMLVELSCMTEEKLAMRMNGRTKKPTAKETALSIGDSSPQDLKRRVSTAVSSGVPRPDVSDSLKPLFYFIFYIEVFLFIFCIFW
ncbi:hypothetical protein LOTGIDRAFT_228140 [Lottia gigantea]|uniref:Uncharacterized protein n=1 Tax=Lottia gigantea TaxID=225164 RepID=V4B563_LOTGI|nr:hypothetical protein LOTGIDRAFT_228140 [Lottia gigantea]ESP05648.1 hypothetical protein LOTGIDRAFT_228140 [Lottia gigantea]